MAYVGTPLDTTNAFQSLAGKRFNGDGSTTGFTLDSAPNSTLDIEVFIENVRQDPNSAYTVSGTTLTFTSAPPSGTNNIYVVHQAKAVGTIAPPVGSTLDLNGAAELVLDADADTTITADTDDQIDIKIAGADDFQFTANTFTAASGSTIVTPALTVGSATNCGINTPAFMAYLDTNQTVNNNTETKVQCEVEVLDAGGTYDNSSNYRWTPGVAGKYVIGWNIYADDIGDNKYLYGTVAKNGTTGTKAFGQSIVQAGSASIASMTTGTIIMDLDADDYVELFCKQDSGSGKNIKYGYAGTTHFYGYKLAGT